MFNFTAGGGGGWFEPKPDVKPITAWYNQVTVSLVEPFLPP